MTSDKITYVVVNGTAYDDQTNDHVIQVLEQVRQARTRVRIVYGNQTWGSHGKKTSLPIVAPLVAAPENIGYPS